MKTILLSNSKIIEMGEGYPIVGIVGLLHGDEICGKKVLDEIISTNLNLHGTIRLIYANLFAAKKNLRGSKDKTENNLNRTFYKEGLKVNGTIEEKTAYELVSYIKDCDYVLDIHSTSYPTEPFVISAIDNKEFNQLASFTGLSKYVIMIGQMANGNSLIDEVNRHGGQGISFESGTHTNKESIETAKKVVYNFLKNIGVLKGEKYKSQPEKYYCTDIVKVPSSDFKAYTNIVNFELLSAKTAYGEDSQREYSYGKNCYPILFSDKNIDGIIFLVGQKDENQE